MPKRCAWGLCNSDSRYDKYGKRPRLDMVGVSFFRFPDPQAKEEECKEWVKSCGRKSFSIKNVTKDMYVCSKHFYEGRPSLSFPNPTPVLPSEKIQQKPKRQPPKDRSKVSSKDISVSIISTSDDPGSFTENSCTNATSSQRVDDTFSKQKTTESSEKKSVNIQTNVVFNDIWDISDKLLKDRRQLRLSLLKRDIFFDDASCKYFTGLMVKKVGLVWNYIAKKAEGLTYRRSGCENSQACKLTALTAWEAYLLTLLRLRQGFDLVYLGIKFGVSKTTVSRALNTWIPFLAKELNFLIQWPTSDVLQNRRISAFKYYPNTIAVIDCTEFRIQKATSTILQRKTWSQYKHHNTLKLLVACTPSGTITFLSKLYTGNISDKEIVSVSGFLENIQKGDNVMADRGFLIRDVLSLRGAYLNIPPFSNGKQLSMHATTRTRRIAKARIIVERAIGRLKEFKILSGVLRMNCINHLDATVKVCGYLCNLQPCLSSS